MLVHKFVHGRPLVSAEQLAETIVLCVFGRLPDIAMESAPFIRLLDNGRQFFNYENQFTITFRKFPDRYEFEPDWHCYMKEAIEKEKAIVVLHDHLFTQKDNAVGF